MALVRRLPSGAAGSASSGATVRVHLYPVSFIDRSSPAALAATSLLPPHGFLVDQSASGIQAMLAERLQLLSSPSPMQADLLFAFMKAYGPPVNNWTDDDQREIAAMGADREDYIPNTMRLQVQRFCAQIGNSTYLRMLMPYLDRHTLKRHVLITPFNKYQCETEARLMGRSFAPPRKWVKYLLLGLDTDNLVPRDEILQRHVSVPYLSSVRWSHGWKGQPPWQSRTGPRPTLICFTGSLRGQPDSIRLRTRLSAACAAQPARTCVAHVTGQFPILTPEEASDVQRSNMQRALRLKWRSTFCLEPPGYSPPRKSAVDSFLSGCIPVFFYSRREFDDLWPFHMGGRLGWGANASVHIPLQKALDGTVDVIETLRDIPRARVREMQSVIASNAHRLVYGVGHFPDDALDTTLKALHVAINRRRILAP